MTEVERVVQVAILEMAEWECDQCLLRGGMEAVKRHIVEEHHEGTATEVDNHKPVKSRDECIGRKVEGDVKWDMTLSEKNSAEIEHFLRTFPGEDGMNPAEPIIKTIKLLHRMTVTMSKNSDSAFVSKLDNEDLVNEYRIESWGEDRCVGGAERADWQKCIDVLSAEILRRMK